MQYDWRAFFSEAVSLDGTTLDGQLAIIAAFQYVRVIHHFHVHEGILNKVVARRVAARQTISFQ
jgi:hypothetical protein